MQVHTWRYWKLSYAILLVTTPSATLYRPLLLILFTVDRITVLENMLSENPDHDDAVRHALIDAYLHAGTASAAVAMLTSMERVPPLRRSQVLLRAGRLQAALAVLQDVPPPVPADIQIQISVCLIRQDRFAEAIDALSRIVVQGDDLTAAVNLSCALLYTNKSAKSIEVLEERLRRDPGRVVRHTEAFAMLNTLYEMTRDNPTREQEVLISIAQEYGPQVPLPHGLDYA